MAGTLYIVATPIGNLEDMTYRAVSILQRVDRIAAEDTRHTRKLLQHYHVTTPLLSYYDHNQELQGDRILAMLHQGLSIALVSDAGTPCIADPGYCLVRDARAQGVTVVPVPGANAAITLLCAAGLPTDQFSFAGFAPAKEARRRSFLRSLMTYPGTVVLYEAPHRIKETLSSIEFIFGPQQKVALGRELTKLHEEILSGTVTTVLQQMDTGDRERGEFVVLIAPRDNAPSPESTTETVEQLLRLRLAEGIRLKEAVAQVAAASGINRKEVYARALALSEQTEEHTGETP